MNKSVPFGIAAVLATCIAVAAEQQDRPAGVTRGDWIPISEAFGFVIAEESAQPSFNASQQLLLAPPDAVSSVHMPPTKGYFVVKTSGGWRRISVAEL